MQKLSLRTAGMASMLLAAVAAIPGAPVAVSRGAGTSTRDWEEAKDVALRASGYRRSRANKCGVKAHQRAAKKARNVRRHRAACR